MPKEVWRWENETTEGKHANVMFKEWMPRLDILNHLNVKALISHGGLLGSIEAVHCGVPMIIMPQYGDQYVNTKTLEASGGGIMLRLSEVTEEIIYKTLKKVLSPSFQIQAKMLSEQFRPLSPLQGTIYWMEYVARHNGALYLRTAAAEFILCIGSITLYVSYAILRVTLSSLLLKTKIKTS